MQLHTESNKLPAGFIIQIQIILLFTSIFAAKKL